MVLLLKAAINWMRLGVHVHNWLAQLLLLLLTSFCSCSSCW
jgi:hypothetical protein